MQRIHNTACHVISHVMNYISPNVTEYCNKLYFQSKLSSTDGKLSKVTVSIPVKAHNTQFQTISNITPIQEEITLICKRARAYAYEKFMKRVVIINMFKLKILVHHY